MAHHTHHQAAVSGPDLLPERQRRARATALERQLAELRSNALQHLQERGQSPSPEHWDQWHAFLDIEPDLADRDYTPLTTWQIDGNTFDLTRAWIDVIGGWWEWTGLTTDAGEPLMQSGTDTPLPLPEVYWTYGPLSPAPRPITPAVRRAAITAPLVAAPAAAEPVSKPTTIPTPSVLAVVLQRLRGRS